MNPRIEKVRDDIKRTEAKIREAEEYLKTLRIRERQLCDEELIKVMRSMAGRGGDVIAMLDAFVNAQESEDTIASNEKSDADKNNELKEDDDEEQKLNKSRAWLISRNDVYGFQCYASTCL